MADEEKKSLEPGENFPADVAAREGSEEFSRILRTWDASGVRRECELCGNPAWSVVYWKGYDGAALTLRRGREVSVPGHQYMVHGMECQKCGNVRLISRGAVDRLAPKK